MENVCGIFSSNKGEDFRAVLESFCKIKDCEIHISRPAKWENAGEILGDNFSVAWRVFDSYLTRNTGMSPKDESVSTLSQILMAQVPEKYYLSPKASLGILRRASSRGKQLPEVLRKALERQAKSV